MEDLAGDPGRLLRQEPRDGACHFRGRTEPRDPGLAQLQLGFARPARVDQEPSEARAGVDLDAPFSRLARES